MVKRPNSRKMQLSCHYPLRDKGLKRAYVRRSYSPSLVNTWPVTREAWGLRSLQQSHSFPSYNPRQELCDPSVRPCAHHPTLGVAVPCGSAFGLLAGVRRESQRAKIATVYHPTLTGPTRSQGLNSPDSTVAGMEMQSREWYIDNMRYQHISTEMPSTLFSSQNDVKVIGGNLTPS